MIKKRITKKRFVIYEIDALSQQMLQRVGLFGNKCDCCNKTLPNGVIYIPVLHRGYCTECYKRWLGEAIYYDEDKGYEQEKSNLLELCLKYLDIPFSEAENTEKEQ